jgi:ABC-2 type transport system ATP-binding protein
VIDLPAGAYSHGQSRRLSMAMALVADAPLLLVDEPFDGVDPDGVDTITELLVEARRAGAAVILTTHLLDAAVIADEVAVFRHHHLAGPHPTEDLLRDHGTLKRAWSHLASP